MKTALAAILCLSVVTPTMASPLAAADYSRLEGEWRMNGDDGAPACGKSNGDWTYGAKLMVEFQLTGGQIDFDTGAEGAGPQTVAKAEKTGNDYVLHFPDDDTPWRMTPVGKDGMKIISSGAEYYTGKLMRRCIEGAPRTGIQLARPDVKFLATTMLPDLPRFVDARAKGGCKAKAYQYLNFDFANPIDPEIRRTDSDALAMARDNKKRALPVPTDEDGMGRWKIEAAAKTATGYDLTVTELIPPNGSRGDKSTLAIVRTKDGIAIPAWKRSYLRCKGDE